MALYQTTSEEWLSRMTTSPSRPRASMTSSITSIGVSPSSWGLAAIGIEVTGAAASIISSEKGSRTELKPSRAMIPATSSRWASSSPAGT